LCLENDPIYLASLIVKQTTKKSAALISGKETKRKTIIKDMKMDPQYGHHINPISRLIQVMQSRKEPEPVFRLIGERGQNRYREFVVQVSCLGTIQTGVGPNKKLAKRAAAVSMLEEIGYVKAMPQPGKSLLKKRSSGKFC
jgi:double-stranded RNA-binding protein Staufen